jgi:hypothetical protein
VLAGACASAALACQVLLGIEEPVGVERPDVEVEAEPKPPEDPCVHARPPAKPAVDDDPTGPQRDFWFSVQEIIFPLKGDAGVQPGFDLDDSCTCQANLHDGAPTCTTPSAVPVICDFDGGIDDSLAAMAIQYSTSLPDFDLSGGIRRQIHTGQRTLLVYVGGYNGKANDSDVTVSLVGSGGLYSNLGCDGVPRDAGPPVGLPDGAPGPRYAPLWDGCDRWSPNTGLVIGEYPARVPVALQEAWVTNHVLVMPIKEVAVELFGESAKVGNGYLVAQLVPEEGDPNKTWRLEGLFAVRVRLIDLVKLIGRTHISQGGAGDQAPLCEAAFWPQLLPTFCAAADVMESPSSDHQGATCNASSTTIGFIATQVQVSNAPFDNRSYDSTCDDTLLTCQ